MKFLQENPVISKELEHKVRTELLATPALSLSQGGNNEVTEDAEI